MSSFQSLAGKKGTKKADAARDTEQALLTAKSAIQDLMKQPREAREAHLQKLEAAVHEQELRLDGVDLPARRRLTALREVLAVLRQASEASSG